MINFTTPNGNISVKSSYYDLTCAEYANITANSQDFDFVFSVLTGIPRNELLMYDLSNIVDCVSFTQDSPRDLEPINFITVNGNDYLDIEVFEETWAKKITADDLVRVFKSEDEQEHFIVPDLVQLVAIYTTNQKKKFDESKIEATRKALDQMPVAEVYPFGLFLEKQLIDIKKAERVNLKSEYTPEQIQAGIHHFNKLGVFNTIDMIAQGDPLKYDAVLNLPFSSIFNKLVLSNISVNFEKRLNKILKDKSRTIGTKNT